MLGICLGMQMMAIEAGGGLVQDLPPGPDGTSPHDGTCARPRNHAVSLSQETLLGGLLGPSTVVSSFHHQAVDGVPVGFKEAARAGDGVLEAIESIDGRMVGVQWHPERDGTGGRIVRCMLSGRCR